MSIRNTFWLAACGLAMVGISQGAMALDPVPDKSGFSGVLGVMGGYTDAETNLLKGTSLWDIGQESISSPFQNPKGEDDAFLLPRGNFAYTFAGPQIQLFLSSEVEEFVDLEVEQLLGIKKEFDTLGIMALSYVTSGLLAQEVWQDPYSSSGSRSDTDRDFTGVRFEWDRIAGLPIGFMFQYRDIEIDDEFSGTSIFGSGSSQANLLSREGDDYRGELRYTWRRSANEVFSPYIGYQDADLDGEAMAFSGPYIGLEAAYKTQTWGVKGEARVGSKEMSKRNPVFGTRTDSDWYEISLGGSYLLPWDNWYATGGIVWARENNDVSFHDQQNLLLVLGAEWHFGRE